MNTLLKMYLGSIVRNLLQVASGWLLAHGAVTQEQGSFLTGDKTVDIVVGLLVFVITALWSLVQKHGQERLFQTALVADPKANPADVQELVKKGLGPLVGWLGVFALILIPATANAQSLNSSMKAAVHDVVLMSQAPAPPTNVIVPGVNDETWLRTAQGVYVMAMAADAWNACNALRQKDVNGNPINEPSNVIIPSACSSMMVEKVGVTIAGLIVAQKLWPDHKWEAIATLAGSAVATLASTMKSVYDKPSTGNYPAPPKTVKLTLRFGF